jgi:hypothetical protein
MRGQVTASYVAPALAALHEEALAAGIVILNEAGLDPGEAPPPPPFPALLHHYHCTAVKSKRAVLGLCVCPGRFVPVLVRARFAQGSTTCRPSR